MSDVAESFYLTLYPDEKPYTMVIIKRVTEADSTYTYQTFDFLQIFYRYYNKWRSESINFMRNYTPW